MLDIVGSPSRFCTGLSRRSFLRVGALGAGLSLADLLRLRASGDQNKSHKAVIMINLIGGPSHHDTYDLKPEAPVDMRGVFRPIHTNVTGFDICELMPHQAKIADKLALVRNMFWSGGTDPGHQDAELGTGFPLAGQPRRPAFGSVISKLRTESANPLPPFVVLNGGWHDPAYLGSAHKAFLPGSEAAKSLHLPPVINVRRVAERKQLLQSFDSLRRDLDTRTELAGMDEFTRRALDMVTSPATRHAFDVSREPDRVLEQYGQVASLLQARRLVEAGVSVVTIAISGYQLILDPVVFKRLGKMLSWDTHIDNFDYMHAYLPRLDRAIAGLVADLHDRGLDKDVAVVVWGEHGRTARINKYGGRDHWLHAGFTLLAGGGFRTGQVIGETDVRGERSRGGNYTPQNVFASLYHHLGIDPAATLKDHAGRPQYLLDNRETVAELH